ncbi:glycosyl transferase family protein [Arthrobacter sp. PAMC 25486]|uniref:glycosyltransferase n=1 Tax=Arthrobacter sp. PAMC 25486 TaxID=1494608 RepID=UPI000535F896|nr:glycosyltransferase [Arthrobacter sp. PAMC 25486]AIY03614.1 glycosyl transferase family protein [Arthrobacter sp. PAMC 25486]
MKILVYPHDMAIGGSQLNAIELAAAVQNLGHEVVVYGQHGPLVEKIRALGLEFLQSPAVHRRPTPGIVADLRRTVKKHGIDVVHAYEWPPALEAALACAGRSRAVVSATVMSMSVAPFIPANMPLLVGTAQIAAAEREFGRESVGLLEPPVDTELNDPALDFETAAFLARMGAEEGLFTISIVSRLAHEMKLEGILCAIAAVEGMNKKAAVQLVIAGDGPARAEVATHVAASNKAMGVQRIFLAGELDDPRPAYACADASIGMGGSALRAMAFGLPLVVQGEDGFWELLDEDTVQTFLWQGWYGVGAGTDGAQEKLMAILERLMAEPQLRAHLGRFARSLVLKRFSLEGAAVRQLAFYQSAFDSASTGRRPELRHAARAAGRFLRYSGEQFWAKLARRYASDDFNATPVAARTLATASQSEGC